MVDLTEHALCERSTENMIPRKSGVIISLGAEGGRSATEDRVTR